MKKDSDMYVNDSKGYEQEAKKNYSKLLDIFATSPNWSQEKLAELLKINSTTLRKYRREGSVSLYTSKGLSQLLDMDRNYFNGKKIITEEIEDTIREKLENIAKNNKDINSSNIKLIKMLKDNSINPKAFDDLNLTSLQQLEELLEKNLTMVSAKIQIVKVVQSSSQEVNEID